MAPLTRSDHYEIYPVMVRVTRVVPAHYPFTLVLPQMPRLLWFKGTSGNCFSCNGSGAYLRCSRCESMQFYCNDACQAKAWRGHQEKCELLKEKLREQKTKEIEETDLKNVSEIIKKVFTPDYSFPECKSDPGLEVIIKDNVSFGSLHDVLGQSDLTTREFQSGLYKCTSVKPYESCEPLTIYHHKSVDPCKIVKQCILMSRDFNDHSKEVNQITQPDWCKWQDSDSEYIPYESESDVSESELIAEKEVLGDFYTKVYSEDLIHSDIEDYDYEPDESESDVSESDSSFSEDISDEVEYLVAESKKVTKDLGQKRDYLVNDMDTSEESDNESNELLDIVELEMLYKEFITNIFESEHAYGSDSVDSDYLPFDDSESEDDISDIDISEDEEQNLLEEGKLHCDVDGDIYEDFVEKVCEFHDLDQSDENDEEYIPNYDYSLSSEDEDISDGEINHLLEESKNDTALIGLSQDCQTILNSSDSTEEFDSEVSTEDEQYEDFKILLEEKLELSDSDSIEYQKDSSESETSSDCSDSDYEMEISDVESNTLVNEVKDSLVEVSRKRKRPTVEMCEYVDDSEDSSDSEYEIFSDEELYAKFVAKLLPEEKVDIAGSDDEFMLPETSQQSQASDSSEEEMEISDTEFLLIQEDLELDTEGECYEDFKSKVIKARKPKSKVTEKIPTITDNRDLIYFINSSNTSDLKNLLDNGIYEKVGVIPDSFIISREPTGMAVAVHGGDWRSAHVFEDASSTKSFALVVATDMGPLRLFKEDWESNFPKLKWTSVSETKLVFNMNDFLLEDE